MHGFCVEPLTNWRVIKFNGSIYMNPGCIFYLHGLLLFFSLYLVLKFQFYLFMEEIIALKLFRWESDYLKIIHTPRKERTIYFQKWDQCLVNASALRQSLKDICLCKILNVIILFSEGNSRRFDNRILDEIKYTLFSIKSVDIQISSNKRRFKFHISTIVVLLFILEIE